MQKHAEDQLSSKQNGIINIVWSYVRERPWSFGLYSAALVTATAVNVIGFTSLTAKLINGIKNSDRPECMRVLKTIGFAMFGLIGINYVVDRAEADLVTGFDAHVKARLCARVLRANELEFADRNPIEYRNAVDTATQASSRIFQTTVQTLVPNALTAVTLMAYLAAIDLRYFAVFAAAASAVGGIFAVGGPKLTIWSSQVRKKADAVNVDIFDVLNSLDSVVCSNSVGRELAGIKLATKGCADRERSLLHACNNVSYTGYVILAVAIIATDIMAVSSIGKEGANASTVVLAITLMNTARLKMSHIASSNVTIVRESGKLSATSRVEELAGAFDKTQSKLDDLPDTEPAQPLLPFRVTIRDFRFEYSNQTGHAVEGISFAFGPKGVHCLRGPSGAGKSTLARVLSGLYRTYDGSITFGEQEIRTMDASFQREQVLLSQQSSSVLNRSIREFIMLSTDDPDSLHADARAKADSVWQVIQQSFAGMDLDSSVGVNAGNLSTGQLQILRLASVQLSRAPFVILDEPCSGLDVTLKPLAYWIVRMLGQTRTVLLITHEQDADSVAFSTTQL